MLGRLCQSIVPNSLEVIHAWIGLKRRVRCGVIGAKYLLISHLFLYSSNHCQRHKHVDPISQGENLGDVNFLYNDYPIAFDRLRVAVLDEK